jgi:hypothetical protein
MTDQQRNQNFIAEFSARLAGRTEGEVATFFDLVLQFLGTYASGYELSGPIHLVLDNSIVQDFKHRATKPQRELRALAYSAFCRFVAGWSDRETSLALSPMAVYEHLGRRAPESANEAAAALQELLELLADTRLPCIGLGFREPASLFAKLRDIEADDRCLTAYVRLLDAGDWKTDLRAPMGVRIPLSIAYEAISDDLPMRYFDAWYVKFVLAARVEKFIVQQSQHDPAARPIHSGPLTQALADLNEFSRQGLLKGLGDIDLLQICDVNRQYVQDPGFVLIGQTLDKGLADVLRHRHVYHVSGGGTIGAPDGEESIRRAVDLIFSNPFSEQDRRAQRMRDLLSAFQQPFVQACERTLNQASPTDGPAACP